MRPLALRHDEIRSFVLYFTKGLGDVVSAEVKEITPAATVVEEGERFLIVALSTADAERLGTTVRTIDDLRLLVAGPSRVRTEQDFSALCTAAAAETGVVLEATPPGPSGGDASHQPWSVTMSARRPSWRSTPTWDPAPIIAKRLHGADVTTTTRRAVDLRIQVDEDIAHVAVNLWEQPIGKRPGEPATARPGALRPTVAAALVRLALSDVDLTVARSGVYDPFCGSGTIAAEATRFGLRIYASDIDEAAVELTRERLTLLMPASRQEATDLRHRVFTHDVRRGPDSRVPARVLVGNMPWGRQVKVDGRLALFDATALLVAHTVHEGGSAALLTTHEDQFLPRLRRHRLRVSARRIGLLGQTPAIVVARPA
ncbi:MAG: TRM11 family SAM-dependent methyltransferase [Pseudonocardiaceae bacterium]